MVFMRSKEPVKTLDVSKTQLNTWLKQKNKFMLLLRPVRYRLFDPTAQNQAKQHTKTVRSFDLPPATKTVDIQEQQTKKKLL